MKTARPILLSLAVAAGSGSAASAQDAPAAEPVATTGLRASKVVVKDKTQQRNAATKARSRRTMRPAELDALAESLVGGGRDLGTQERAKKREKKQKARTMGPNPNKKKKVGEQGGDASGAKKNERAGGGGGDKKKVGGQQKQEKDEQPAKIQQEPSGKADDAKNGGNKKKDATASNGGGKKKKNGGGDQRDLRDLQNKKAKSYKPDGGWGGEGHPGWYSSPDWNSPPDSWGVMPDNWHSPDSSWDSPKWDDDWRGGPSSPDWGWGGSGGKSGKSSGEGGSWGWASGKSSKSNGKSSKGGGWGWGGSGKSGKSSGGGDWGWSGSGKSGKPSGGDWGGEGPGGSPGGDWSGGGGWCGDSAWVTVTNLSFQQSFSEIFSMTAAKSVTDRRPIYIFGNRTNEGLQELAQDAKSVELENRYLSRWGVEQVKTFRDFRNKDETERFLRGGARAKFKVRTSGFGHRLSIAVGLPFTNDGAVVLQGARIYDGAEYWVPAIDVGAEGNIQTCWSVAAEQDDFPKRSECAGDDISDKNYNDIPGEGFVSMHRGIHDFDEKKEFEDLLLFYTCEELELEDCGKSSGGSSSKSQCFSDYFWEAGFDDDELHCSNSNGFGCDEYDDQAFLDNLEDMDDFNYYIRDVALDSDDFQDFCDNIDDANKKIEDSFKTLEAHLFDWRNEMMHVKIECAKWENDGWTDDGWGKWGHDSDSSDSSDSSSSSD